MKFEIQQTERKTLGDQVYRFIRESIIHLQLKPGQMVYENELSRNLGISRTPIREAFRMLLSEEFIEILPQRGARIAYISKKKVQDAWFIRSSLEVSAFKEIAAKWDLNDEKCKELADKISLNLTRQKNAVTQGDLSEFFRLDEEYHNLILNHLDNSTLMTMISQMRGHINRVVFLELQDINHVKNLIIDHEKIFNTLTSNDVAQLEKLLIEHFTRFSHNFSNLIEKYPDYFINA